MICVSTRIIMWNVIMLIIFLSNDVILALIDLNYCNTEKNNIDKIIKKPGKFDFEVRMEGTHQVPTLNVNKSFPCCAPKGSVIQWFYGDIPLKNSSSTFKVWPYDDRYIVSFNVNNNDLYDYDQKRSYKCIATNEDFPGTTIENTSVLLKSGLLYSFNNYDDQEMKAVPGETITLRCSRFLGYDMQHVNFTSVEWISKSPYYNITHLNSKQVKKEYVYSAGGEVNYISTVKIKIDDMILNNTFTFTCYVKLNGTVPKGNDGITAEGKEITVQHYVNPVADMEHHYNVILIWLGSVLSFFAVISFILLQYHIEIRLIIKDKFGRIEISDKKNTDVFVCYYGNNDIYCAHTIFINKKLVPHLEKTLGYSCFDFVRDIKGGDNITGLILERILCSRRLIIVLCDDLLKNKFHELVCQNAINEALERSLPIICILPEKSERQEISHRDKLNSALQIVLNVAHKVTWPGKNASSRQYNKFWNKLRLYLPPRRHFITHINV